MRKRMQDGDSLEVVRKHERRYDERCADHARRALREWVDAQGSEVAAARLLEVDQSTVNRNLDTTKQPTLKVLISLSKLTAMSLDQLLGLDPVRPSPTPPRMTESERRILVAEIAAQVTRKLTPPGIPAAQPPRSSRPPKRPT